MGFVARINVLCGCIYCARKSCSYVQRAYTRNCVTDCGGFLLGRCRRALVTPGLPANSLESGMAYRSASPVRPMTLLNQCTGNNLYLQR